MLTAVVKRPDRFGATVSSFDAGDARKIPGVVDVVQIASGVAVVAKDTCFGRRGVPIADWVCEPTTARTVPFADLLAVVIPPEEAGRPLFARCHAELPHDTSDAFLRRIDGGSVPA